jgi:hypothetical protein
MAKENFSELSTEDLIKKKKTITLSTGVLAGALIGLFIITIFQTINDGVTPFLAVPFAFVPILIICYKQVSAINKELKSRY